MSTPTRDELDAMVAALGVTYDMWWGDVADRIVPLIAELIAERDAALAGWRDTVSSMQKVADASNAWRASADRLAACFDDWMLQAAPVREALAEYERLGGATQLAPEA